MHGPSSARRMTLVDPSPALPFLLLRPERGIFSLKGDCLAIEADAATNYFVDPASGAAELSAPAAVLQIVEPVFTMKTRVSTGLGCCYDGAGLIVENCRGEWAKCLIEQSPFGRPTLVSVVTKKSSDDANGDKIADPEAWLRLYRCHDTLAFHWSTDGIAWKLLRYFHLAAAGAPLMAGMIAQAPLGDPLTAMFTNISIDTGRTFDIRHGS